MSVQEHYTYIHLLLEELIHKYNTKVNHRTKNLKYLLHLEQKSDGEAVYWKIWCEEQQFGSEISDIIGLLESAKESLKTHWDIYWDEGEKKLFLSVLYKDE